MPKNKGRTRKFNDGTYRMDQVFHSKKALDRWKREHRKKGFYVRSTQRADGNWIGWIRG